MTRDLGKIRFPLVHAAPIRIETGNDKRQRYSICSWSQCRDKRGIFTNVNKNPFNSPASMPNSNGSRMPPAPPKAPSSVARWHCRERADATQR